MQFLLDLLNHRAMNEPDRLAVIAPDRSLTYGELVQRAGVIAADLHDSAIISRLTTSSSAPLPPFALTAELSLSFVEAWWGAILAKLPLLLQHPHDPPERRILQQRLGGVAGCLLMSRNNGRERWSCEPDESAAHSPTDAVALIATSGSSGQPKIIPIREQQLIESARRVNDRLVVDNTARWMLSLMPSHIGGVSILMRALVAGCPVVIPDNLKRTTLHQVATAHRVSHLSLVPSVAEEFIAVGPLPPSLRVILLGGERITRAQRKALAAVPACYLSYGATETASCIAVAHLREVIDLPDAVGRPLPDTRIQIIGESGEPCSVGELGTVEISGPTVTTVGSPSRGDKTFPTWRSTDQGFLDGTGILHILGRLDDVIISGGIKISAGEILEAALATKLVEHAAVVKAPDPRWGEHAVLFVTAPPTTIGSALSEVLRDRLGSARAPREIVILTEFPRTAIGKIDRAFLTEYANSTTKDLSLLSGFVREHYSR